MGGAQVRCESLIVQSARLPGIKGVACNLVLFGVSLDDASAARMASAAPGGAMSSRIRHRSDPLQRGKIVGACTPLQQNERLVSTLSRRADVRAFL